MSTCFFVFFMSAVTSRTLNDSFLMWMTINSYRFVWSYVQSVYASCTDCDLISRNNRTCKAAICINCYIKSFSDLCHEQWIRLVLVFSRLVFCLDMIFAVDRWLNLSPPPSPPPLNIGDLFFCCHSTTKKPNNKQTDKKRLEWRITTSLLSMDRGCISLRRSWEQLTFVY